jgi:hypothetical protein
MKKELQNFKIADLHLGSRSMISQHKLSNETRELKQLLEQLVEINLKTLLAP